MTLPRRIGSGRFQWCGTIGSQPRCSPAWCTRWCNPDPECHSRNRTRLPCHTSSAGTARCRRKRMTMTMTTRQMMRMNQMWTMTKMTKMTKMTRQQGWVCTPGVLPIAPQCRCTHPLDGIVLARRIRQGTCAWRCPPLPGTRQRERSLHPQDRRVCSSRWEGPFGTPCRLRSLRCCCKWRPAAPHSQYPRCCWAGCRSCTEPTAQQGLARRQNGDGRVWAGSLGFSGLAGAVFAPEVAAAFGCGAARISLVHAAVAIGAGAITAVTRGVALAKKGHAAPHIWKVEAAPPQPAIQAAAAEAATGEDLAIIVAVITARDITAGVAFAAQALEAVKVCAA